MNRSIFAVVLSLALAGSLAACGGDDESDAAAVSTESVAPAAQSMDDMPNTDYDNIPGMAMGSPPETASMNCAGESCDLVFIPPSESVVRPFGIPVRLLKSNESEATVSIAETEYTVKPGASVKAKGATVRLVGTPGTVVTLNVVKA
ncbi:MAG: hypothetical protein ACT4QG_06425 [Sporichthyaceae bacterium]